VSYEVENLELGSFDLCGLDRAFFVNQVAGQGWEYVQPGSASRWVCGATLCYRKSFWENHRFPDVKIGEDTRFVLSARGARIGVLDDNRFFVARIHAGNTSPKGTHGGRWQECPIETMRSIVGSDWEELFGGEGGLPRAPSRKIGTALVSAASGIGDILRVTPLIRVAYRLGYEVDVLLSPDDPAAAELLRGAREIRRLVLCHKPAGGASAALPDLTERQYDVATFTGLSAHLSRWVQAGRHYTFEGSWRAAGEVASIEKIARELGWQTELPTPFAIKSARRFDLPRDTIALHPGCKPNWPWKKWHGFDELAGSFANVAIVGTAADLDNNGTYFKRAFQWPEHVRNFVGQLDLPDTAALLSQCAALVSLDSGIMHLGVALGVPTFGIFGITSPERECMPSPFMIPITKQLPCEPACHRMASGRRDCEYHLECLKALTAEDVAAQVAVSLPGRALRAPYTASAPGPRETITLNYYGEVFAASGYGEAARAYVLALQAAGVAVRVVNTGPRPQQIRDERLAALLGYDPEADFNLFHGIPAFWARAAYQARNVIAMTVWEADQMPQTWRNPLSHAIDVWLPSAFTIDVFTRGLGRAPYRLPHALPPRNEAVPDHGDVALGVEPTDFVFYSIFEWQDRKNPHGLIEAFLAAFPEESDAVLLLKAGSRAASEADQVVKQLREQTHSRGRIVLHCASFDDSGIQALHARGDCYVSLHRGEGWGYPLFEAAGRGKPIVATAYGGPLDYLDSKRHWLVRHTIGPVRRPYFLYRPSMSWAEPDLGHASEGLHWVYEHRAEAHALAEEAAREIRTTFSLERIGEAAKARLIDLKQANGTRDDAVTIRPQPRPKPDTLPILGEWYDADYFEHGVKSNWKHGYAWPSFQGIFKETAALLGETFPEATSYVDAGCAKGFLVQALRERGLDARGFDHSPWAVAHAQVSVQAYLELAPADSVAYTDRSIDVLVAMSLFESLTEEQIRHFLPRARRWVRRALFATIPIQARFDRDLSHITMREPQWWCERFTEAGWRQDPLQETVERHPLPKRMKWRVYVFEPGA
jgi:ADP-heptose:LPS heptosyltransferase